MMSTSYSQLLSKIIPFKILSLTLYTLLIYGMNINPIFNANASFVASNSIADIVDKIAPAVVNISSTKKLTTANRKKMMKEELQDNPQDLFKFFMTPPEQLMPPRKMVSMGSGFLIDPSGYIVTNNHVIEQSEDINVTLSDNKNKIYKAKVIGRDKKTDIALIKINVKDTQLPFLEFNDSDKARVGDMIIAIGNPFGLGGTVTSGMISAKARNISANGFDDFIQTDAAINTGNSGGPLCDMDGKVIGINSIIFSPSGGSVGIGFAITSNILQPVIKQLKEKGVVERGWLGVKIQAIDQDIASSMDLTEIKGALVSEVVKDSPADKAGIKTGDLILLFDGVEIKDYSNLVRAVGVTTLNKKVDIQLLRNKEKITVNTIIIKPTGESSLEIGDDNKNNTELDKAKNIKKLQKKILGMTLSDMTQELKKNYNIEENITGVVVVNVDQDSSVAFAGVRVGDVIERVNNTNIKNIKEIGDILKQMEKDKKEKILLLISRTDAKIFIAIDGFEVNDAPNDKSKNNDNDDNNNNNNNDDDSEN